MTLIAVLTTVPTVDDARRIARALVDRQLAACVQISPIESFYRWDGAVRQDAEFRIVAKTTAARYPAVETAIRELHGYDLPAIYALPVAACYPPYADWVANGSAGNGSGEGKAAGGAATPVPADSPPIS